MEEVRFPKLGFDFIFQFQLRFIRFSRFASRACDLAKSYPAFISVIGQVGASIECFATAIAFKGSESN